MPKKVILIHDSYTNPQTGWYLWLQTELAKQGITVYSPKLPTPIGQSIMSWNVLFSPYLEHIGPETVIIGHGTGALFALRVMENAPRPIGGLVLVAPYVDPLPNQGLTMVSETFLKPDIAWDRVHKNCELFSILAASNDPFIPVDHASRVAELCGVPLTTVTHEGHFLIEQPEFPEVITALSSLAKPLTTDEKNLQNLKNELAYTGVTLDTNALPQTNNDDSYESRETIKGITSFYDDVKQKITAGEAESMATLLSEERQKEQDKKDKKKRFMMNVMFLALGIIAIAVGIYIFSQSRTPAEIPLQSLRDPSPLRASSVVPVQLRNNKVDAVMSLQKAIEKSPAQSGNIVLLTPTDVSEKPLGFAELMDTIEAKTPASLRGVVNSYLYGYYQKEEKQPFLLLSVNSFDAGYAGLREWESTILIDLYRSVISARKGFTRDGLEKTAFTDMVASNKQIRVASVPRQVSVTKEISNTEIIKLSELPETIIYKPEWKAVVTDTSLTFTTLPKDLEKLRVGDVIVFAPTKTELGRVVEVSAITPGTGSTVITIATTDSINAFKRKNIMDTYTRSTDETGAEIYTKTTTEQKTVLEDAPAEPALYTTFLNNKILLITTDIDVADELTRRLSTAALFQK